MWNASSYDDCSTKVCLKVLQIYLNIYICKIPQVCHIHSHSSKHRKHSHFVDCHDANAPLAFHSWPRLPTATGASASRWQPPPFARQLRAKWRRPPNEATAETLCFDLFVFYFWPGDEHESYLHLSSICVQVYRRTMSRWVYVCLCLGGKDWIEWIVNLCATSKRQSAAKVRHMMPNVLLILVDQWSCIKKIHVM